MSEYVVNKAGAKIYNDVSRHTVLEIPVVANENINGVSYKVLSVGMVRNGVYLLTIQHDKEAVAYRLPVELTEWAQTTIGLAMSGIKALPANIEFGILKNRYYAEIL